MNLNFSKYPSYTYLECALVFLLSAVVNAPVLNRLARYTEPLDEDSQPFQMWFQLDLSLDLNVLN